MWRPSGPSMSRRSSSLGADLVVAGGNGFNPPDAIAQLRSVGIPVLVLYAPSVDGVYTDIEKIGDAVGNADEATALTGTMKTEMDAIASAASAASAAEGTKPRVFYDVGYTDGTGQIYGAAEGSFLAEMVGLLGVDVITSDPVTYEIPLETLIEKDPQVILLGVNAFYTPTPETVSKRTGWSVLTAVKNGDIRPVQDTEITRPGPRLPTGLRNLAWACTQTSCSPLRPRTEHAVSVTALSPDLGALGLAERIRGRPGLIAVAGLVALALLLVAGVTLGSARIGPATRSGSSCGGHSASTSAGPGPRPPRRSCGTCGCRGS